jgi:hypothetical protein
MQKSDSEVTENVGSPLSCEKTGKPVVPAIASDPFSEQFRANLKLIRRRPGAIAFLQEELLADTNSGHRSLRFGNNSDA